MKKTLTMAALVATAALASNACAAESTATTPPPAAATASAPAAAPTSPPAVAPAAAAPAPATPGAPAKLSAAELDKVGKAPTTNWTVEELFRSANLALNKGGRSFERGQKAFEVTSCALCHHFGGGVGGIGPDLTGVGGKFGAREILESIIEPNANISDLYSTVTVHTADGRKYTGRPQGSTDTSFQIIGAPSIDPATGAMAWIGPVRSIPHENIVEIEESGISPMPPGLINNLTEDEIYDFLAYLISAGNPDDKMFKVRPATPPPAAGK